MNCCLLAHKRKKGTGQDIFSHIQTENHYSFNLQIHPVKTLKKKITRINWCSYGDSSLKSLVLMLTIVLSMPQKKKMYRP